MALQHTNLAFPSYVPSTVGSVYANPASTKTYVRGLILFNGNTSNETVKIHFVPNSSNSLGTAGAGNQILEQILIAKETLILDFPTPFVLIGQNDSIQAVTTTGSKVTFVPLGDKE